MNKKILILIITSIIIVFGIIYFVFFHNKKELTWEVEIESNNETCIQVIQKVYEDENYVYNVSNPCYADRVYVVYSDGKKYKMMEALSKGKVTPNELIAKGVSIFKDKK